MSVQSFEDLAHHVGHHLECVIYGNRENVAIECHDCSEILLDFDRDYEKRDCQVCGKNSDQCECICPTCDNRSFDDVTIADHGECYDCHKARLMGEIKVEEMKPFRAEATMYCARCSKYTQVASWGTYHGKHFSIEWYCQECYPQAQKECPPRTATLYNGDNGVHEYWQTDHGKRPEVFLKRNHRERTWTASIEGALLEEPLTKEDLETKVVCKLTGTKTAQELVPIVQGRTGITVTLSTDKRWTWNPRTKTGYPMILIDDAERDPEAELLKAIEDKRDYLEPPGPED